MMKFCRYPSPEETNHTYLFVNNCKQQQIAPGKHVSELTNGKSYVSDTL